MSGGLGVLLEGSRAGLPDNHFAGLAVRAFNLQCRHCRGDAALERPGALYFALGAIVCTTWANCCSLVDMDMGIDAKTRSL